MTVLVVIGIVAAALLGGKTNPVRVGFSGGSQALEHSFTATAAALGVDVTVSDIADVTAKSPTSRRSSAISPTALIASGATAPV